MSKRVFLSYSTQDRMQVERLKERLRAGDVSGIPGDAEIFDSAELSTGSDVREAILEDIRGSSAVVAIWSSNASTSSWVHYELGAAAALNVPITIVVVEEDAPAVPSDVSHSRIMPLSEGGAA
jgi:hypothetical protein